MSLNWRSKFLLSGKHQLHIQFRNWVLICTRLLFRHFKSYNVYKFNNFTIVIDLNTIDYTMLFILTYLWYILSCYGSCLLIWLYLYYSTFCNSRVIFGLWHFGICKSYKSHWYNKNVSDVHHWYLMIIWYFFHYFVIKINLKHILLVTGILWVMESKYFHVF